MRTLAVTLVIALISLATTPALADDRDFCADRPGIGTPPCTLAPGSLMLEATGAEWDHSSDAQSVEDKLTLGDFALRVGVTQSAEVQFGLTSYIHDRDRDRATGLVSHQSGVGDAFVAVRQGLAGPNGPVAIQAFVIVPTGDAAVGAGDWGGGVLLPVQLKLPSGFQLGLTPEIDAAVDADGKGRHLAYGGVAGLSHDVGKNVSAGAEIAAFEDEDPGGHSLDARVTGELAWQVNPRLQLDVEGDLGLSSGAPDHAVMVGFAEKFR